MSQRSVYFPGALGKHYVHFALWKGAKANTYQSPSTAVEIMAAVLCFASDIPGVFGEPRNYSGFDDRDQLPKRSSEQHRRDANRVIGTVNLRMLLIS